eukprot:7405332-Heterocapsa_arctica.AAC.1
MDGGSGGQVPLHMIKKLIKDMAAPDTDDPQRDWQPGWTRSNHDHHWHRNPVTENSIYDIGGVGLPPFEMFEHCLPKGSVIRLDAEHETTINLAPATDRPLPSSSSHMEEPAHPATEYMSPWEKYGSLDKRHRTGTAC